MDLAPTGRFPSLPLAPAPAEVIGVLRYSTAAGYVRTALVADPARRIAAMERDGFRRGVRVEESAGPDHFSVLVLELGNPAKALDLARTHLRDACTRALDARPVPGGGVAYLRSDGIAIAVVVVGRWEISASLCTCVESPDRLAAVAAWAQAITYRLGPNPT